MSNGDQLLQAVFTLAEEVGTIVAGHVPDDEWEEVAGRLLPLLGTLEGHPASNALRTFVLGVLAGFGHVDYGDNDI